MANSSVIRTGLSLYPQFVEPCALRAATAWDIGQVCQGRRPGRSMQILSLVQEALAGSFLLSFRPMLRNGSATEDMLRAFRSDLMELSGDIWAVTEPRRRLFHIEHFLVLEHHLFVVNRRALRYRTYSIPPLNVSWITGLVLCGLIALIASVNAACFDREEQFVTRSLLLSFGLFIDQGSGSIRFISFAATPLLFGVLLWHCLYGNSLKVDMMPRLSVPFRGFVFYMSSCGLSGSISGSFQVFTA